MERNNKIKYYNKYILILNIVFKNSFEIDQYFRWRITQIRYLYIYILLNFFLVLILSINFPEEKLKEFPSKL